MTEQQSADYLPLITVFGTISGTSSTLPADKNILSGRITTSGPFSQKTKQPVARTSMFIPCFYYFGLKSFFNFEATGSAATGNRRKQL
jgi:hypothetical protein